MNIVAGGAAQPASSGTFTTGGGQAPSGAPTIPGVTLVTAGGNNAPIILVIAAEKAGKCLAGDTRILQANGTRPTIAELVRDGKGEVVTMAEGGVLRISRPSHFYANDPKKLYRLTTQTGRSIMATENHPFFTREGWVELKDLRPGVHRVAIVAEYPYIQGTGEPLIGGAARLGKNAGETAALTKIVAYLIADGSIGPGHDKNPTFTKNEDEIRNDFVAAVETLGDSCIEFENGDCLNVRLHAGRSTNTLEELGLLGCKAGDKFVPERILNLPSSYVRLFLNRLFTCDGSVEARGKISYSSKSRRLLDDVQHLLSRFGVNGVCRTKIVNTVPYYELVIASRDDVIRFVDEIGMLGEKGERAAEARALVAKKIANPTQLDRMGHYLFDRVVSIEYVETAHTYDLTVEGTHNFVANDFVVHNSATCATTLVGYPDAGKDPLVLAWDKYGPDACIRLGYQPHAIRIADQPGGRNWDKARGVLENLERNTAAIHARYGAIINDCTSTMVDRLHEDARRFSKNPDPRSHFGDALMQSKEWINRVVDLGLPTIWLAWLKEPEVSEVTSPTGQKTKKFTQGGPNILGNTRQIIAGKAHHIVYLEKAKYGVGSPGADEEGYIRVFHTRPYENINCSGRYSHVLPEPCPAHMGFVLGAITGRGPWAPRPA